MSGFKRAWFAKAGSAMKAAGVADDRIAAALNEAWDKAAAGRERKVGWRDGEVSLEVLFNTVCSGRAVVGGYGALFDASASGTNWSGKLLETLSAERKQAKKEMFQCLSDGNSAAARIHDMRQKTIKIIMNSWFGVATQRSFPLYNYDVGATITHTGVLLVTSVLSALEWFMAASPAPETLGEAWKRVLDSLEDEGFAEDRDRAPDFREKLAKRVGGGLSAGDFESLSSLIDRMSDEDAAAAWWRTMPVCEFLREDETSRELLLPCLTDGKMLDPSNPSAESAKRLDWTWERLRSVNAVFAPAPGFVEKAKKAPREAVLGADTDSVFVRLGEWRDVLGAWGRVPVQRGRGEPPRQRVRRPDQSVRAGLPGADAGEHGRAGGGAAQNSHEI